MKCEYCKKENCCPILIPCPYCKTDNEYCTRPPKKLSDLGNNLNLRNDGCWKCHKSFDIIKGIPRKRK